MTEYFKKQFEEGLEFQDFIQQEYYKKRGIVIGLYGSRKYQIGQGESVSGYEIKYDKKMSETGNLYFEYAEKSDADNPYYVDSGILRDDNTRCIIIGNYEKVLIVGKWSIKRFYDKWKCNDRFRIDMQSKGVKERIIPTSKGIVIPYDLVKENIAIDEIVF